MPRVRLSFGAILCAVLVSQTPVTFAAAAGEGQSAALAAAYLANGDAKSHSSANVKASGGDSQNKLDFGKSGANTSPIFSDDDVAPGTVASDSAAPGDPINGGLMSDALPIAVSSKPAPKPLGPDAKDVVPVGAASAHAQDILKAMRETPKKWTSHESDLGTLYRDLSSGDAVVAGIVRFDDVREIFVETKSGNRYFATATTNDKVENWLNDWAKKGGTYAYITPDSSDFSFLRYTILVLIFVTGFFVFRKHVMPRRTQSASSSPYALQASTKKAPTSMRGFEVVSNVDTKFSDVIGVHEAKEELQDVLDCLRAPEHFRRLNAKAPRGVLLSGPPGTGKTLLARALAGEAHCSYIATTGSHFINKYIGESSKNVRALFELARKNAPCIIFIDEVDGLGKRSSDDSGGTSEHNATINAMLTEMDGFSAAEGIVVVAATNHPEMLDEAMLREGRFDYKVTVKLPTVEIREELFRHYAKKTIVSSDVDLSTLARRSTGMSPSGIASAINRAAKLAAKRKAHSVDNDDLRTALEQQILGSPDKFYVSDEDERQHVAYHEAGHAVIGRLLNLGVVDKVTIVPHGQARGVTFVTNERDDNMQTRKKLFNRMVMLMGGRAAELLQFNEHGAGVSDDLGRASKIAYEMVSRYGFGTNTGAFSIAYLDKSVVGDVNKRMIQESEKLVQEAADEAYRLLEEYRPMLTRLADTLLDKECVEVEELAELLAA